MKIIPSHENFQCINLTQIFQVNKGDTKFHFSQNLLKASPTGDGSHSEIGAATISTMLIGLHHLKTFPVELRTL